MFEEISKFIQESMLKKSILNSREWFENEQIRIYIRYTPMRLINGNYISTIDIASVIVNEKYRSKGIFTNLLSNIENKFNKIPIYVESILNEDFKEWLIKRGYKNIYVGEITTNCLILERK